MRLFNFKAIITILVGIVYFGGLLWALLHDKLDINSFLAGVGPMFGLTMNAWFGPNQGESK